MPLLDFLKLPETRGIVSMDDVETTALHREIILRKPFLKRMYDDFYREIRAAVEPVEGKTLIELGSGGGFMKEIIPTVITSDIKELPWVDRRISALDMPLDDASVDAFLLFNVLHHIPDVRRFFREAQRCLKPGGRIVMIEPTNTPWSKFVYQTFHHEPFVPGAAWEFPSTGPMSSGNDAMPWIVFVRDRAVFEREFPALAITRIRRHTPFRHLVSGGVSMRAIVPSWSYGCVKFVETMLTPLMPLCAMYMTVVVQKSLAARRQEI